MDPDDQRFHYEDEIKKPEPLDNQEYKHVNIKNIEYNDSDFVEFQDGQEPKYHDLILS